MTADPAYRIVTDRLVIRCYHPSDAPLVKESIDSSLEHLRPWMPWAWDEPQSVAQKAALLRRFRGNFDLDHDYIYGIFDLAETRLLGGTGLHTRLGENVREIGYWIRTDSIGMGYATETSAALTRVAFEILGINRIEIHCDPNNTRSANVPQKLGYTHEVTRRKTLLQRDGSLRDTMIWTLLREEYPGSPSSRVNVQAYNVLGEPLFLRE